MVFATVLVVVLMMEILDAFATYNLFSLMAKAEGRFSKSKLPLWHALTEEDDEPVVVAARCRLGWVFNVSKTSSVATNKLTPAMTTKCRREVIWLKS